MTARRVGLGLVLALGVSMASGAAWAQTPVPGGRGQLAVLGLRALDGDDEAAQNATNALRALATENGWTVPTNTPGLEQAFTLVGCDNTGPECLSRISDNISAPRFIFGTVTRIGRNTREARVSFELAYWDQADRRIYHQEVREMLRANGRLAMLVREEMNQVYPRLIEGVPDELTRAAAARAAQEDEARRRAEQDRIRQLQTQLAQRPNSIAARAPVVRYIGFGLVGLGAVLGSLGIWQAVTALGMSNASANAGFNSEEPYRSWFYYDNQTNPQRTLSTSEVCDRAQTDAVNPYAAEARNLCSSFGTARTLGYALGIGGLAMAAAGAVLVVLDRPRAREALPPPSAPGAQPVRPTASRVQWRVNPVLGGPTTGLDLQLTF